MSNPIKDEKISDCKENVSSDCGGSEDNRQENSDEQDSENETKESKTEASDDSDTKSPKSEILPTKTMDYSDNSFPSGDGTQRSPVAGPSREPNLVCDDADNSQRSQCQENIDNSSTSGDGTQQSPVAGPSREPNLVCDDANNSLLREEIYGPRTNLTDYADVSEATSDGMEPTIRVQRKTKKKPKAANESENESVEEGRARNPNIFLPIRNEGSTKEAESTTTDDVRVTPFEDIGLEQNQNVPCRPPSENLASSVEGEDSGNPDRSDDGSVSNKSSNPKTPDEQSSVNESDFPEMTDEQSSVKESDFPEMTDEQSSVNESDIPETTDEQSSAKESDIPETTDEQSSAKESDIPEMLDEQSSAKESDNPETPDESDKPDSPDDESTSNKSSDNPETSKDEFAMDISDDTRKSGDESVASKSDSLETSESEGNKPYNPEFDLEISLDDSKDKASNSQKRKLSTIHEEPEEIRQVAKRLRPSKSFSETEADMTG